MKLCLGTVQQGLEYGINNKYGKPSKEYSQKIFYEAVKHGITMFDTARDRKSTRLNSSHT